MSCILTHLQHPHSTHQLPPIPPSSSCPSTSSTRLLIYALFVGNYCDLSCAGPRHILCGSHTIRDSLGWDNRRKYYKHLSSVATFHSLPRPLRDDGVYLSPFPSPLLSKPPLPAPPLYQVFSSAIVTSCIFFPGLLVVLLALFGCFGFLGHHCHVKRPRLSPRGHFYSVLFVVALDFFICLVYVAGSVVSGLVRSSHPQYSSIFSDPCFVVPIAQIPSCFDGRFATFPRSYPITLVVPEMMNLTVKSSRAGSQTHPASSTLPSFPTCSVWHTLTHSRRRPVFSFMSAYPLSVFPTVPLRWLVL